MNKLLSLLFVLAIAKPLLAQIDLKGKVIAANGEPLAYTSIGIPNANIGTYTFEDGTFQLKVDPSQKKDSIQFSHLGYRTKYISIEDLLTNASPIITLDIEAQQLSEIFIGNDSNKKTKVLGIVKKNSSSDITISKPANGSEVAVLIDDETGPYSIEKVKLNVASKNINVYSIRLKIYTQNALTLLPDRDITPYNIQGNFKVERGEVEFVLKHDIVIDAPIFLSFEWLVSKADALRIAEAEKFKNVEILSKYTSLECPGCSRVIENNRIVNFYNNKGESVTEIKLTKDDRAKLKRSTARLPRLAFQTTKSNHSTYYRYASFGKWYKYSQSLIASIEAY